MYWLSLSTLNTLRTPNCHMLIAHRSTLTAHLSHCSPLNAQRSTLTTRDPVSDGAVPKWRDASLLSVWLLNKIVCKRSATRRQPACARQCEYLSYTTHYHYSLLTTHYSLLITHYSLLTTHYTTLHYTLFSTLLTTPHTTHYTTLHATHHTLHTTRYTLHTARYTLHTTHK